MRHGRLKVATCVISNGRAASGFCSPALTWANAEDADTSSSRAVLARSFIGLAFSVESRPHHNIRAPKIRLDRWVAHDLTMAPEPDRRISQVVDRERSRLLAYIRRRVPGGQDAEDILQDVFAELVEANQLLMPIEHVTGWLFRVARNRITDLFRKKAPEPFGEVVGEDDERMGLEELLLSNEDGPEALLLRSAMLDELFVSNYATVNVLADAEIRWPIPERFSLFGLETFGYEGEVVLPIVARPERLGESLRLEASIDYLVCKEICVPTFKLSLGQSLHLMSNCRVVDCVSV